MKNNNKKNKTTKIMMNKTAGSLDVVIFQSLSAGIRIKVPFKNNVIKAVVQPIFLLRAKNVPANTAAMLIRNCK